MREWLSALREAANGDDNIADQLWGLTFPVIWATMTGKPSPLSDKDQQVCPRQRIESSHMQAFAATDGWPSGVTSRHVPRRISRPRRHTPLSAERPGEAHHPAAAEAIP